MSKRYLLSCDTRNGKWVIGCVEAGEYRRISTHTRKDEAQKELTYLRNPLTDSQIEDLADYFSR